MKTSIRLVAALIGAALSGLAHAGETGTMRQATTLMAGPYRDANVAGNIAERARVEILERRGAWLQVQTPGEGKGKKGWVRLHQVSIGEGAKGKASGEDLRTLWNVKETGRSGAGGIVATTGIRGMSADQLKNAPPNVAALQELERLQVSKEAAQHQAQEGKLNSQISIGFLPDPK